MKLALVRQRYTPWGGAERFVDRALQALSAQQVDITLITRDWSGGGPWKILRCDPPHAGRLWRDWSFARCVGRALAARGFDLVQSHERIAGCSLYRAGDGVHATWLELRGRQQTAAARLSTALTPWHRYVLRAEARMYRHPALRAVICNSRMVRDDIAARFGVAADKLHVIYNGVDLERFHPGLRQEFRAATRSRLDVPEDAPLFLFLGSGFERKGLARLLQALAAMGNGQARLLVVGRDRRQKRYEALAQRLGVAARTFFLGPQQDVRPYLGAADAAVLPTLYDPLPNAALEALACGLPLITSGSCGAAELIRPGANGYVCDALDVGTLAAHMDVLAAPQAARSMAQAARATVAELSLGAMAGRLDALYRDLLGRGAETAPPL